MRFTTSFVSLVALLVLAGSARAAIPRIVRNQLPGPLPVPSPAAAVAFPCSLECPPGAALEGEPTCHDGYSDRYNGGCQTEGWTEVCPTSGSVAVMCGEGGTFLVDGMSYRDTDWLRVHGNGTTMTASCVAEFPMMLAIMRPDCALSDMEWQIVAPCETATLSHDLAQDEEYWLWIGATQFSGIPCGSRWILTVDGVSCVGTAVEPATWGKVKGLYR